MSSHFEIAFGELAMLVPHVLLREYARFFVHYSLFKEGTGNIEYRTRNIEYRTSLPACAVRQGI